MIGHYHDLKDKTFLVTGASSGIGQAVAIALGQQGAKLIITGRDLAKLETTCQQAGAQCSLHTADLTDASARDSLVNALPALDGICHAAGIIKPFPVRYLNEAEFDAVFNINAKAPILLTSALLGKKKLNTNASIVFLSSIASGRSTQGGSIYAASKAALEAYSRNIILEHAAKRIRANCLKPALVKTAMYEQTTRFSVMGGLEKYEKASPLGLGETADVAAAALFFLSAASRWIAGTTLLMDGGLSAGS